MVATYSLDAQVSEVRTERIQSNRTLGG